MIRTIAKTTFQLSAVEQKQFRYALIRSLRVSRGSGAKPEKKHAPLSLFKHVNIENSSFMIDEIATSTATSPAQHDTTAFERTWNWVPPNKNISASAVPTDSLIPVIKREYLTLIEVNDALKKLGAENIVTINVKGYFDTIDDFVIASFNSTKLLKKSSDVFVRSLKDREIKEAPGYTGAEGEKDDDWYIVDCHNIVIHFLLPKKRIHLGLEAHLSDLTSRPYVAFNHDHDTYEQNFERVLARNPMHDDDVDDGDNDVYSNHVNGNSIISNKYSNRSSSGSSSNRSSSGSSSNRSDSSSSSSSKKTRKG